MLPEIYNESIGFQSWAGYRGTFSACNKKKRSPYQTALNCFSIRNPTAILKVSPGVLGADSHVGIKIQQGKTGVSEKVRDECQEKFYLLNIGQLP